ncbi:Protein NLRC5 [Holothuria leucospilota]|uniref:Protein NLRC5 n=1 Tax=Holothuria leucospilota TaxID=206669 RepID=A0A9Q1CNV7_HOLLE|nr:Protein NLRC5 [Holothuria leucospilota]
MSWKVSLQNRQLALGERLDKLQDTLQDKKTKFKKQLRNKYKKLFGGIRPVPFLREKYNIEKLYVESEIKFLEDSQGGGNHDRQKWTRLSSYKKIFTDSRVKSKRYIVDGEPGIGKSTLALRITHDWCLETSPMDDFEIVILLRLRQCKKSPSFYSAIKQQLLPKDSKLSENDIENILNGSTTLVILDGYDEFPGKGSGETNIEDIITGEMLPDCDVILMTRTSCLPEDVSCETMRIRMWGFENAARHTYIRNVVARGDAEKAGKINQLLNENPVIGGLCTIPLFFVMISYLIYENESCRNLRSSTELLRLVVACFHGHDEIKKTDENKRNDRKLAKDHHKLDKVAFEGLSGDIQQTSWKRDKIRGRIGDDFYDDCVRVGILIEDDVFDFDTIEYKT